MDGGAYVVEWYVYEGPVCKAGPAGVTYGDSTARDLVVMPDIFDASADVGAGAGPVWTRASSSRNCFTSAWKLAARCSAFSRLVITSSRLAMDS